MYLKTKRNYILRKCVCVCVCGGWVDCAKKSHLWLWTWWLTTEDQSKTSLQKENSDWVKRITKEDVFWFYATEMESQTHQINSLPQLSINIHHSQLAKHQLPALLFYINLSSFPNPFFFVCARIFLLGKKSSQRLYYRELIEVSSFSCRFSISVNVQPSK